MQIFVRIPTGKTISLEVKRSITLGKLKAKIEDEGGIPLHQQRFIIAGENLEGPRTLRDYNIQNESTFYLSLQLEDDMRIFVRTWSGKIITLVVENSDTIGDVKGKIGDLDGTPLTQYRLFVPGKNLEDGITLKEHNIKPESTLYLARSPDMEIYVKLMSGKTISLVVDSSETVYNVKAKIAENKGIPPHKQRLVCSGRELEDVKTLRECNVEKHSTLHSIVRLLGGVSWIFVKTLTGKTINLHSVFGPIEDWKAQIQDKHHQRLVIAEKHLDDDDQTLKDYNIQHGSTLELVYRLRGFDMEIFVKIMTWKTITLDVEISETTRDVKEKIFEEEGIPPHQQSLTFLGMQLRDDSTLANQNIQPGSTLHLLLCMTVTVGEEKAKPPGCDCMFFFKGEGM
ncbi:hypothetical protein LXL04_010462 [Taraxacum kok-saghyz]